MRDDDIPSVEELLLNGVIEVAAMDSETGEFLYNFTKEFKETMPELYAIHTRYVHGEIMYFWEKGFVSIDDFNSTNPIVTLTNLAFDNDALETLPKDKLESLREIKRILK